jgi:oxygen-dependent protoporphyrinogen oxidase
VFYAPAGGMGRLVDELVARLRASPAVEIRLGSAAERLTRRDDGRWDVDGLTADRVVLTVPAFAAAELLRPVSPGASGLLAGIPYAGVVMVTLALPESAFPRPLDASGHLVPKPEQRHVTACSWASTKWARWKQPGQVVLRASVGRYGDEHALGLDDDAVVAAVLADLSVQLGVSAAPTDVRITRWPASFPQYLPGHVARADAIAAALHRDAPGVMVAGAAYRGIGLPACVRQGREAATAALAD